MALDIYLWLTHRCSYLKRTTEIPWRELRRQFGAGYGRTRAFKAAFVRHAGTVLAVYPRARLQTRARGLVLRPSAPQVSREV